MPLDELPHHSAGRDIVDFLATELERNIASELKVDDGASIPEKMCR
jgi:hypothetical protein